MTLINSVPEIQYCALPECNKPFSNWRRKCCCTSHQGRYSAKMRWGTLNEPDKPKQHSKGYERAIQTNTPFTARPKLTQDQKKANWCAYVVARRKLRDKSMPQWADKEKINEIYLRARELTALTGIRHEVDHIIPSNHELVCGLHCEFNLQILSKDQNCQKSNKFVIQ
jgi:hypothetical protein